MAHLETAWANRVRRRIQTKFFATGLFLSVAAALLVIIVTLALGEYTQARGRLFLTALLLAGFGLTGLGHAALAQRAVWPALWPPGLLASLTGVALLVGGVWGAPDSDAYWTATAIIVVLGLCLAYASWALWLEPVSIVVRRASRLSAALALAVGAAACVGIGLGLNASPYQWAFTLLMFVWFGSVAAIPAAALLAKWSSHRRR